MSIKKSQVVKGVILERQFRDGTVARREVLGDADSRSTRQVDKDEVTYKMLTGAMQGQEFNVTKKHLADWADRVVTPT